MFISLPLFILAAPALAWPHALRYSGCDVSNDTLSLPSNQTVLVQPTSSLSYVGVGLGVQNYTCNATSLTYTNVGAVAELFDMSCLSGTPSFSVIQDDAYKLWETAAPSIAAQDIIRMLGHDLEILGQHYFVPNPRPSAGGPAISPKWDFTSSSENGNPQAYVIAAKVGDLPAPSGQCDVDWLELKNVEGELATSIYRVATKGGSPPPSCVAGGPMLSVKYASQYWLYGGNIKK